ncbi:pilin [Marinobacter sp. VGCF2001]|uniref:pilin n=1 Tax=Marinobacter sp. VGCF2001 TaxID=3417189 RepID=UPI003CF2CA57
MNRTNGFTLIELMIVVALIGIVTSLALPAYQTYSIKAKLSEAFSMMSVAKAAIHLHHAENGTMPSAGSSLMTEVETHLTGLPSIISTDSTSSPANPNEVTMTLRIRDLGGSTGDASSNSLALRFLSSSGVVRLDCSSAAGTTIEPNFLPDQCRN